MLYPVHETFHSWQGEGEHLGKSAFFIRLFGCPVHCPWCDSAGTWHPDYVPKDVAKRSVEDLVESALAVAPEMVVITGGEPSIHDLRPLTGALGKQGLKRHLETSGAFTVRGTFDWITLSPKWQSLPLPEVLEMANEFKLVIESTDSAAKWVDVLGGSVDERPVWLQPEWSKRKDSRILRAITEFVKERGAPFRAGLQAHKYYRADSLDPSSAHPAPLGGDPELGY